MIRSVAIAVLLSASLAACANVKFEQPEARHETADARRDRTDREARAEQERIVRCQTMSQRDRDRSGDCR